MKKRILSAALLLVLALVLFGCDNDSDTGACEHSWTNWTAKEDGHYHVCTECGIRSKVFAHNCDDAYDIVDGQYVAECRVCKCKVYTPVYPAIEAEDESQNARYLAQIDQAFKALDEIAENSDISVCMNVYLSDGHIYQSLSDIEFSCKNSAEVYFELKGKNGAIYHEENGKIYSYTESKRYDYDRKYVCSVDDFLVSSEALAGVNIETGIDLDVSRCNITKEADKYIIEAYAADILGEDVTAMLTEIYKQLDMDSEMLSKITVKIELEFTQTSYSMSTYMSMFAASDGEIMEMPFKSYTSIDYSDIEKIDFLGGEYTITPPYCIEDVYTISDDTEEFEADQRYYAVRLKKGQYFALHQNVWGTSDDAYGSLGNPVSVFNAAGEKIENLDAYRSPYCYNFVIPSDGLYYLKFNGFSDCKVTLIRCDYETIYDINAPKTFDMNVSGVIEGLYDLEYYVFTSECRKSMTIKNTSDITLHIVVNRWDYAINAGAEITVDFEEGENEIIVTAKGVPEKVNYSLECTEVNK